MALFIFYNAYIDKYLLWQVSSDNTEDGHSICIKEYCVQHVYASVNILELSHFSATYDSPPNSFRKSSANNWSVVFIYLSIMVGVMNFFDKLHRPKRKMRQNKLKIKCLTLYNENKVK